MPGKLRFATTQLPWERYRADMDRTEPKALADDHPAIVKELSQQSDAWYLQRHGAAQQSYI